MSIDRRALLQGRSNALRAMNNFDLPQSVRDQFKKAADHAEVALGLDAAMRRKQSSQPAPSRRDE